MQSSYAKQARAWLEELCDSIDREGKPRRSRREWWVMAAVGVAAVSGCHSKEAQYPAASERDCQDGRDDDGDGQVDCADRDCDQMCAPAPMYMAPPEPSPRSETDCGNGADDDGDGLIDRSDPDCAAQTAEYAAPAYAAPPRR